VVGVVLERVHMTLKLICHSRTQPLASPDNGGFDLLAIRGILRRLESLGVPWEIADAMPMSDEQLENLYIEATLPTARAKYRVRQVFGSKRHAGFLFGRGVPALLVYEDAKPQPADVYPHRRGSRTVTIRAFLEELLNTLEKAPVIGERRKPDPSLVARMDRLRGRIGPIGVGVAELVREGRRK
jgi:hypothetical protein